MEIWVAILFSARLRSLTGAGPAIRAEVVEKIIEGLRPPASHDWLETVTKYGCELHHTAMYNMNQLTVIVLTNSETADTMRIGFGVAGLYVPALVSPEVKKQF